MISYLPGDKAAITYGTTHGSERYLLRHRVPMEHAGLGPSTLRCRQPWRRHHPRVFRRLDDLLQILLLPFFSLMMSRKARRYRMRYMWPEMAIRFFSSDGVLLLAVPNINLNAAATTEKNLYNVRCYFVSRDFLCLHTLRYASVLASPYSWFPLK